jgi:hypothetical protein
VNVNWTEGTEGDRNSRRPTIDILAKIKVQRELRDTCVRGIMIGQTLYARGNSTKAQR